MMTKFWGMLLLMVALPVSAQMSEAELKQVIAKMMKAGKYEQALNLAKLNKLQDEPSLKDVLAPAVAKRAEADRQKAVDQAKRSDADKAEAKKLLAGLAKKEDKIERITWYQHKSIGSLPKNQLYFYFGIKDGRPTALRSVMMYYGEDWIFAEKYVIAAGNGPQLRGSAHFRRDHTTTVWETADLVVDDKMAEVLMAMLKTNDVTLRLQGKYVKDIKLSKAQTQAAVDTLKAYAAVNKL